MNNPDKLINSLLSSKKNVRIKLLGDSVTHGLGGVGFEQDGDPIAAGYARNPNGYCWAKSFKDYMAQGYGAEVVNNGCCGADIQFLINYFDTLVDTEDDLIICTIGSNNRPCYGDKNNLPSREEYGKAFYGYIEKLYGMCRDAGKEIIFVADIPCVQRHEEDGENYVMLLHMDDINTIHKRAAENLGFPLVGLYELFLNYCRENDVELDSLYWDGQHPNDRGYDVMFELLIGELRI